MIVIKNTINIPNLGGGGLVREVGLAVFFLYYTSTIL